MSFAVGSPRGLPVDHEATIQAISTARGDGRLVDASVQLERWIASCKKQGSSAFADGSAMSAGGGLVSRLTSRNRAARDDDDDATMQQLRGLVPKVSKVVEKEGSPSEQITFLTYVNKQNAAGKVQQRLLLVSDQAVYNMSMDGKKSKRRILLSHIGHVTMSEPSAQFVLHVPSEYDYHYASPTRGHSLLGDDDGLAGSPVTAVIDALQRSYARHVGDGRQGLLPIRTFNGGGPLSDVVKKKSSPADEADATQSGFAQYGSVARRGEDSSD